MDNEIIFHGIDIDKDSMDKAERLMNYLEKQYQEKNPCPACGSHNVHICIDALGGGNVDGSEWCDDCGWKKRTNTFPSHNG